MIAQRNWVQGSPEMSNSNGWGEQAATNNTQEPTDVNTEYATAASDGAASVPLGTSTPAPIWGGGGSSFAAMAAAPAAAKQEEQAQTPAAASHLQQRQQQQQKPPLPRVSAAVCRLPSPGKLTNPSGAAAWSPIQGSNSTSGAATAALPNAQLREPLVPDSAAMMSWITQRGAGDAGQPQEEQEAEAADDLNITEDDFTVVQSRKKKQRGAAAGRDKERKGGAGTGARGGHQGGPTASRQQQHGRQQQQQPFRQAAAGGAAGSPQGPSRSRAR